VTVPFVGGWACTDRDRQSQRNAAGTGRCGLVPASMGAKGDARIMPALYDHLRWCIPRTFTIIVDRKSVGYRCVDRLPTEIA
jgi:hypothetical protein